MKLLINASNLNRGGALQVAYSFLNEIKTRIDIDFYIVLSVPLAQQIEINDFPGNFHFYFNTLKNNFLTALYRRNKFLKRIENYVKPDCVFTVFGPSFWISRSVHILGYADGWCFNPDSIAYEHLNFRDKIIYRIYSKFKNHYIKKEADVIIAETEPAKLRIASILKFNQSKIEVVGNTCNQIYYLDDYPISEIDNKNPKEFRLFSFCANYPQKNLKIINNVVPLIKAKGLKVRFYVTIPEDDFKNLFPLNNNCITNLGAVPLKYGPSIYKQIDALFLPTLLETFTASYPEAMKMGKPILTSDLPFAHYVCENAAEYFDPVDPEDIANKIEIIVLDNNRRNNLIELGHQQFNKFESPSSRADKYLEICKKYINEKKLPL